MAVDFISLSVAIVAAIIAFIALLLYILSGSEDTPGPTGPTGPIGPTGPAGPANGPTGATGATGSQGSGGKTFYNYVSLRSNNSTINIINGTVYDLSQIVASVVTLNISNSNQNLTVGDTITFIDSSYKNRELLINYNSSYCSNPVCDDNGCYVYESPLSVITNSKIIVTGNLCQNSSGGSVSGTYELSFSTRYRDIDGG